MIDLCDVAPNSEVTESAKPIKKWRTKFEANSLIATDLIQYFEKAAPSFFIIENGTNYSDLGRCSYDEQGAKTAIIDTIEEFICGDNPQSALEKIKIEGNISSVCGRVFKMGEPTYSCRACGMDPTCVLCVNCFKQSAHRHHKYKMGTSGGGGCCDCGDSEAWKNDPHCDEHIKGTQKNIESSVITTTMRERCNIVFESIMQYCVRCLEFESDASMRCIEDGDADEENIYCTVLYNDETHTFEQVIQTLNRIVGCNHRDAIEYVSSIDREGRAVVKCAPFDACLHLKNEIENQALRSPQTSRSLSLKVAVLHKKAVACQEFALQLLAWFQDFLSKHAIFREIFCKIITQDTGYNLAHILSNDFKLWKTARTSWHRLLISGMLMEYENKKLLAVLFTKYYPSLMQDFIRDDHDHSFSIVSLSVQLFTVPSIAQYLIAHECAFFKLMHTFYSESIEKYVKRKVLQFVKNIANLNVFKRSAFILFDIRYILSFKPTEWSDDLRHNFLHGVQILMKLMKEMQGMDAVSRQTGQHMEYEPEWESAFNLHIKLSHVITLVLEWCGTDKVVLVKAYRMVMLHLLESEFIVSQTTPEVVELADHSTTCLMYDVASKNVSIHLPLTRFFAGLYLHLEKFGLTFDNILLAVTNTTARPTSQQIIEPVLCTQTMIAQVHSGLWRRNGYSLLNQLYFYRNVKCRVEMLDRDIVVLQFGASLIESNEFLIHILNKFQLISWINGEKDGGMFLREEDTIRQIVNMVDEMLELLIVIVGERYVPGIGVVSDEAKMKKEIIQQLCIKPHSHSELNRALPDNQHDIGMESVINDVAVFKKPIQSDKIGVYELKPEYYDDYNMFFYHYTKEDKSRSEEAQRHRRKANNELDCCPPPKLPKLTETFSMLANLLQCDVMLLLMQTVLKRAVDLKEVTFSESHLQKVLYLIGYALQEQSSEYYPFFAFYERSLKWGILQLLEELTSSVRVETHRDLIIWTIKKFKELQPSTLVMPDELHVLITDDEASISSSRSVSDIERTEKEERARLAAERRAKILAQMSSAQKNFMSTNAELYRTSGISSKTDDMDWLNEENDGNKIACLGVNRKQQQTNDTKQIFTCILCSEESRMRNITDESMVYSAFIQKSNVLSHINDLIPSPHIGTCGHVMHATCFKQYYDNEVLKENRRPNRNRTPGNFMVDKKEFLCPLCRCLSNAVLPITPHLKHFPVETTTTAAETRTNQSHDIKPLQFTDWLLFIKQYFKELCKIKNIAEPIFKLNDENNDKTLFPNIEMITEQLQINYNELLEINYPIDKITNNTLKDITLEFIFAVRRVVPFPFAAYESEPFLATWMSCAYTVEALEMYLRSMNKPLKGQLSIRNTSCLSGLITLSGFISNFADISVLEKLQVHFKSLLENLFLNDKSSSVIKWDIFKMLVTFIYMTPSLLYVNCSRYCIPSGTLLEYYFLKLMFIANIVKILILYKNPINIQTSLSSGPNMEIVDDDIVIDDTDTDIDANTDNNNPLHMETDEKPENLLDTTVTSLDDELYQENDKNSPIVNFYLQHNFYLNEMECYSKVNLHNKLIEAIRNESQTFLRCSCLFFQFLTNIDLPDCFSTINGDTFENMCEYLGLNANIESYFNGAGDGVGVGDVVNEFIFDLATHKDIEQSKRHNKNTTIQTTFVPCMTEIRKLIELPDDYSDLINNVSTFTCPNNTRDDSRNPTKCLVCGVILCSMTYCCQKELDGTSVGACTYHAHDCGGGVGIFLRIRDCEILLLGLNKGCFMQAPYLDEYGETDQGLRRGNPLRLCKERYRKIELMWLNHGLYEEIARVSESINSGITTQWHHL